MQRLLETEAFSSLHYGHMPFGGGAGDMEPAWHKPQGDGASKERSHGDGILVGADLGGGAGGAVLADAATGDGYVSGDRARAAHGYRQKTTRPTWTYQGLVREEGKTFTWPKTTMRFVALPGACASQNRDFRGGHDVPGADGARGVAAGDAAGVTRPCKAKDPFVKTYMDWLAHHEFGLGHKPFRFDAGTSRTSGSAI